MRHKPIAYWLLLARLMGDDSMCAAAAANGICLLAAPWDDSWYAQEATLYR
jgi:hypothetical protein